MLKKNLFFCSSKVNLALKYRNKFLIYFKILDILILLKFIHFMKVKKILIINFLIFISIFPKMFSFKKNYSYQVH